MPINYEPIDATTDVATTRTLLHEVIPLTGTIVSGTYGTFPDDTNVKNYSHGMFQSVYDYPYLSSSANHIFDITVGYDETSPLSSSSGAVQRAKKINMYNQFSQVLLGYTGSANEVRKFESDLTLDGTGEMKEVVFVNFSRLLTKDEIKKGSFEVTVGTGSWANADSSGEALTFRDSKAADDQGTLSTVGGDYGLLLSTTTNLTGGIVFYQAGLMVLTSSVFTNSTDDYFSSSADGARSIDEQLVSGSITGSADALRHRIQNLQFNNTTEINSTVYFCRLPHNKYNYSSNPTYLNGGAIRVKNLNRNNPPISYVTTIGLYNSDNELLAVAKLSEPLRKDPTNELTLRVRLDY
jgi:hypothetical protein